MRGPDAWQGPNGLRAGFGRDAAPGEWFYGFRLARRTDLQTRLVRAWGIVPAGAPSGPDERQVAAARLEGPRPRGLLLDRGVTGRAWAAAQEAQGTRVVLTPGRAERRRRPTAVRRPGPEGTPVLRNRLETSNGELTERLGLARHGAKRPSGAC